MEVGTSSKTLSEEVWMLLHMMTGIKRESFWKQVQLFDNGVTRLTIPVEDSKNKLKSISITLNLDNSKGTEQTNLFN